jgi:hypothetical protein
MASVVIGIEPKAAQSGGYRAGFSSDPITDSDRSTPHPVIRRMYAGGAVFGRSVEQLLRY